MNLIELKGILSAVIFVTGAVGALLPWILRGGASGKRFMVRGDNFAGAVGSCVCCKEVCNET